MQKSMCSQSGRVAHPALVTKSGADMLLPGAKKGYQCFACCIGAGIHSSLLYLYPCWYFPGSICHCSLSGQRHCLHIVCQWHVSTVHSCPLLYCWPECLLSGIGLHAAELSCYGPDTGSDQLWVYKKEPLAIACGLPVDVVPPY